MDFLKNKFVWVGVAVVVIGGGAFAIHSHNSANKQLTPYTAMNGSQRVWYIADTDDNGGLSLNSDVDTVLVSKGGKITEYPINGDKSMNDFVGKSDSDVIKEAKSITLSNLKNEKKKMNQGYKRLVSYLNSQKDIDDVNWDPTPDYEFKDGLPINVNDGPKHVDLKDMADRKTLLKKVYDESLKTVDNYSNIKPGKATFEGVSADGNNVTEETIKWNNSSDLRNYPLLTVSNGDYIANDPSDFTLLKNDNYYKKFTVTKAYSPADNTSDITISRQYPSKQLKDKVYAGYVGTHDELLITNVPAMTAKITDANGNPSSATGFDSATQKGVKFETD